MFAEGDSEFNPSHDLARTMVVGDYSILLDSRTKDHTVAPKQPQSEQLDEITREYENKCLHLTSKIASLEKMLDYMEGCCKREREKIDSLEKERKRNEYECRRERERNETIEEQIIRAGKVYQEHSEQIQRQSLSLARSREDKSQLIRKIRANEKTIDDLEARLEEMTRIANKYKRAASEHGRIVNEYEQTVNMQKELFQLRLLEATQNAVCHCSPMDDTTLYGQGFDFTHEEAIDSRMYRRPSSSLTLDDTMATEVCPSLDSEDSEDSENLLEFDIRTKSNISSAVLSASPEPVFAFEDSSDTMIGEESALESEGEMSVVSEDSHHEHQQRYQLCRSCSCPQWNQPYECQTREMMSYNTDDMFSKNILKRRNSEPHHVRMTDTEMVDYLISRAKIFIERGPGAQSNLSHTLTEDLSNGVDSRKATEYLACSIYTDSGGTRMQKEISDKGVQVDSLFGLSRRIQAEEMATFSSAVRPSLENAGPTTALLLPWPVTESQSGRQIRQTHSYVSRSRLKMGRCLPNSLSAEDRLPQKGLDREDHAAIAFMQGILRVYDARRMILFVLFFGLACVCVVPHLRKTEEDLWLKANEVPRGAMEILRSHRAYSVAWMEKLEYNAVRWVNTDRVAKG